MPTYRTILSRLAMTAAAVCVFAVPSEATEGYSAIGFGARTKALAGAGVADSRDATAGSLNPAGLVHVGDEIDVSMSVFSPRRGFDTSNGPGPFLPANSSIDSDRDYFFIPNVAWSTRAFKNPLFDVMAFNMVGNGGMNTSYPTFDRAANPCITPGGAVNLPGVFCAGASGINLLQMVMSVAMAKQIAPGISVGVAPMMALQSFDARGIGLFNGFTAPGASIAPDSTNDWSYGFGVRGGIEISPMRNVRIGIAGTSPIWMEDFNHYTGLFANRGQFDIPASLHAGIAVDLSPQLTVMLDWRHIWFSSIDSVGNPQQNLFNCPVLGGGPANEFCFGGSNGPGFGWDDVDAIKFGIEYRANQKLTLRAGYAWNSQPIGPEDVTLNTLAPAVTQHHITAGLEYDLGNGYHLELAGMYAPEVSVSGPNMFNALNPGAFQQQIDVRMWQFEGTVGIKYKFGEAAEPLK